MAGRQQAGSVYENLVGKTDVTETKCRMFLMLLTLSDFNNYHVMEAEMTDGPFKI